MAQSILIPLINNQDLCPEDVFGVVAHQSSVKRALAQLPKGVSVVCVDDPRAVEVWNAPVKILGVKPQQLDSVLTNFSQLNSANSIPNDLLISLLAGVTLTRLKKSFPDYACVRAVPNTPVLVRGGLTGLSVDVSVSSSQRNKVLEIFQPVSEIFELPEDQIDAFLALTSSGPAYVALIVEALADGAVAAGLPRFLANDLAHKTLYGSSLLLKEKGLHPGQLKDMVASPGGTTIMAIRSLEKAGIRSALMEAVVTAAERSRELA